MGYIMGAYSDDNNPNATGKWTLALRRAPGEPCLIFSDMDHLNARPQQRKVPDTPSPNESPAAGPWCRAHTPSPGRVVWRGIPRRSIPTILRASCRARGCGYVYISWASG